MSRYLFTTIVALLFFSLLQAQQTKQYLHGDWVLQGDTLVESLNIKVPSTVHQALIKRGIIRNPFYERNLDTVNWISNRQWQFTKYFDINANVFSRKKILLVFDGLDTYCDIKLNGVLLGQAFDAFNTWKYDVTRLLKPYNNLLTITFANDLAIADSLAKNYHLQLPETSRQFIRKPAYQFGWDFVPQMLSCGITGDVFLAGMEADQPLIRKAAERPLAQFDSIDFKFIKDGKTVFIKGVNYVPNNAFSVSDSAYYKRLVERCKEANVNMIRVWGGGIILPEYFYYLCDQAQLMVWQDLPFANGMYPNDFLFNVLVREEVENIVDRLKHHPCIVLWCGNNEINEAWHNWGWAKAFSEEQQKEIWNDYRQLFEIDFPAIIKNKDPYRPYISSSPKHGWGKKESMTDGDSHYWGVWWGKEPISNYKVKVPRFMSEYGMQAMPDMHSIREFCSKKNLATDNPMLQFHQQNKVGFETIRHYLKDYPTPISDLAYIYFTQILQRDAIANAVSAHRSASPYCNGTMLWQLNDAWPGITWSIIDYYNRPKAAFYKLKHLYDSNLISLNRVVFEGKAQIIDTNTFAHVVTLVDPSFNVDQATTKFIVKNVYGETVFVSSDEKWEKTSGNVYYMKDFFAARNMESFNWKDDYLIVEITAKDGRVYREPFFFVPPKKLHLEDPLWDIITLNENTIEIQAKTLIKDIYLMSDDDRTIFSDNYFTMLPGESKIIHIDNYNPKRPIKLMNWKDFIYPE